MEIRLDSEIFSEMNKNLENHILFACKKLVNEEFSEADITLKINIAYIEKEKDYVSEEENLGYKEPCIVHKVTSTFKQRMESQGSFQAKDMELMEVGNRYFIQSIKKNQRSMFDDED